MFSFLNTLALFSVPLLLVTQIADSVLAPATRQNDNEAEKSDPLKSVRMQATSGKALE